MFHRCVFVNQRSGQGKVNTVNVAESSDANMLTLAARRKTQECDVGGLPLEEDRHRLRLSPSTDGTPLPVGGEVV